MITTFEYQLYWRSVKFLTRVLSSQQNTESQIRKNVDMRRKRIACRRLSLLLLLLSNFNVAVLNCQDQNNCLFRIHRLSFQVTKLPVRTAKTTPIVDRNGTWQLGPAIRAMSLQLIVYVCQRSHSQQGCGCLLASCPPCLVSV